LHVLFSTDSLSDVTCDLLAVAVSTDLDADIAALEPIFDGTLTAWARNRKFTGAIGTKLAIPTFGKMAATEVVLVGIGDGGTEAICQAAALAGRTARASRARHLALALGQRAQDTGSVVERVPIGNYNYERYRPETDRTPALEQLTLLGHPETAEIREQARCGVIRAAGQSWARELVNHPAADIYPQSLADEAAKLTSHPDVTIDVWDEKRLIAEDCVGIMAVGQGSVRQPRLIHLSYRPAGATAHIALVGKGVTFDSGGLSLKTPTGMQTMRCDMGGAATVLGITRAASELGIPVNIDTFVGAAENMVSGNSYKLGDVLRYRNGVTVEIHNTDAEGRLVMADCLIAASRIDGVSHILDFATLTGACVVAIGPDFTGLFTDDDDLASALSTAADEVGEGLWRLPLHARYKELLKAEWGQIKNVGGRDAGATTAALFLQHFVDGPAWAHLDIAGSAFQDKAVGPYVAGGTGQMVRTVTSWLEGL